MNAWETRWFRTWRSRWVVDLDLLVSCSSGISTAALITTYLVINSTNPKTKSDQEVRVVCIPKTQYGQSGKTCFRCYNCSEVCNTNWYGVKTCIIYCRVVVDFIPPRRVSTNGAPAISWLKQDARHPSRCREFMRNHSILRALASSRVLLQTESPSVDKMHFHYEEK